MNTQEVKMICTDLSRKLEVKPEIIWGRVREGKSISDFTGSVDDIELLSMFLAIVQDPEDIGDLYTQFAFILQARTAGILDLVRRAIEADPETKRHFFDVLIAKRNKNWLFDIIPGEETLGKRSTEDGSE
jgi:hypothetical protein